jgi:hypothetical protein
MDLNRINQRCEECQQETDVLWQKLLPLAGPQALRIFVLRSVLDGAETASWLRHLRFFGDGRPVWISIAELVPPQRELSLRNTVQEILGSIAVKTVEQFGGMPERPGHSETVPPEFPTRRKAA